MSGKQSDKEESKLDKFKQLFGIKGTKLGSGTAKQTLQEFILTPDLVKDIGSSSPTVHRLKTLRDLSEIVQNKVLEENGVEVVWECIKDLLKLQTLDERQFVLKFLVYLIRGQYEHLGIMRAHFFQVIRQDLTASDDLRCRLELLQALSYNGKELEYFEEEMGLLLQDLMKDCTSTKLKADFYILLINTVKFNAAYLDEGVITSFVLHTCATVSTAASDEEVEQCLRLLETMLSFCYLPSESLQLVLVCLCCLINRKTCVEKTWQLMKKLLGTHLGHSAIYQMCCILNDSSSSKFTGEGLLRGAVYFVGMALWSPQNVPSMRHPPSAILPYFLKALVTSNSDIVTQEVVIWTTNLVIKYNQELLMNTWDWILDITEAGLHHTEETADCPTELISVVHNLLTALESLFEKGQFYGSADRLFAVLESCISSRPENSVMCLISYRMKHITPAHDNWLNSLKQLVEIYFRKETRSSVHLKVLEVLTEFFKSYKDLYQDELIEAIVLPNLANIDLEPNSEVKLMAVELIVDLAGSSTSRRFHDLLGILQKVLLRPLSSCQSLASATKVSEGAADKSQRILGPELKTAVYGIIKIFQKKLFGTETDHLLKTYQLLIEYMMELMTCSGHLLFLTAPLRKEIIDCLLDLRADESGHAGLLNRVTDGGGGGGAVVSFSSYIHCGPKSEVEKLPGLRPTQTEYQCQPVLPFGDAYDLLCLCIETERDWTVLTGILERLPFLLQNKMLLSSVHSSDIERLASRMCRMLGDRKLPEHLISSPGRVNKSDFHAYIFPVLTCLVSFHNHLDKNGQVELVHCLEFGLVSKCALACIRGLTVCALEMQNTMMRLLPSVLLKLSKICATVSMAVPLMEFLSSLIHLPQLYSNFVEEQYKFVFAIALPYTNPFKYSHYTVSLAYHVIAMWFIKCRLPLRRGFVRYVIKGLKSNVLRQIEESETYLQRINQDSSDRSRTQSLNEEALRNGSPAEANRKASQTAAKVRVARESGVAIVSIDQPTTTTATTPSIAAVPDQSVASNFHKELRDTCVDMLSRYAYFTSSSIPKRSPVSDFLLSGGQSQSWLVGNSIVTITTSGGSKVGKSGLCEKCLSITRATRHLTSSDDQDEHSDEGYRRRHKSAAVATMKEDVSLIPLISQDDMSLSRRQSRQMTETVTSSDTSSASEEMLSLASTSQKMQAVDNVLMGLKAKPLEKSVFTAHVCNCWCTQWAEVHIRRTTGNFSWMMRIQNEQDLTAMFPDFVLSDISNLFKPFTEESAEPRKIDSSSLEEKDYIQMMEEFFHAPSEQRSFSDHCSQLPQDSSVLRSHSSPELKFEQPVLAATSPLVTDDSAELQPGPESQKPVPIMRSVSVSGTDIEKKHPLSDDKQSPLCGVEIRTTSSFETAHSKREQRPRSGILSSVSEESDLATSSNRHAVHQVTETKAIETKSRPSSMEEMLSPQVSSAKDPAIHGGVNPTFLFLQLFHNQCFGMPEDSVLALPTNETTAQSLKLLDMIFPYETHKIGVIYVKPGQTRNEMAILSNMFGSTRYMSFLQSLGQLLRLSDCNPLSTYLGGLDNRGTDGQFAYAWHADFMQVIFHVVTLMPFIEHDKQFTEKKKHIGNDYVTIVYDDSGEDYRMGTIKGQFNFVNIIIKPLDHCTNEVTVQTKPEIEDMIAHKDRKIISDTNLGLLVRQMAVHANLASTIYVRQKVHPLNPYASNWLERLRRIKCIRERVIQEKSKLDVEMKTSEDFSIFTQ